MRNVQGNNFDQYYDYPLSLEALNKFESNLKRKIKRVKNLQQK